MNRSTQMRLPSAGARRHVLPRALFAALCTMTAGQALAEAPAAEAAAAAADAEVTTLDGVNVTGERGYTVEKTTAGTRMNLSLREIPQSVTVITRDRMDDQNLQSITDVLNNVTGISVAQSDSERLEFYARGFYIDNYQFDGIPAYMEQAWSYGDSALDVALYDRVEVVRGATGLLTGSGNPSASINLVRKHALSREFTGTVSVGGGDFNKTRSVADVTVPLSPGGNVRARVIGVYQDGESDMDRYNLRKKIGSAIIDADLTDSTLLSVGYEYQKKESDDVTWGGFPLFFSDGTRTNYDRSFNPAADWTFWDTRLQRTFASLQQGFDNGWTLKANVSHEKTEAANHLFYPFYTIFGFDRATGGGVVPYSGNYLTERKADGADVYAEGPFQLFGREHHLVAGASYNRREFTNNGTFDFPAPLDTYFGWNGAYPEPNWSPRTVQSTGTIKQKAAYVAGRFSLADPLTLLVGARYTDWQIDGRNLDSATQQLVPFSDTQTEVTPYAGLVYDINDVWSTYVSYTEIFNPQTLRDANGGYLDPLTGKGYEAGVKAAWFDDKLNASLAVFRIEQDNLGVATGGFVPGSSESAYEAANGVVSEGFDFEISGRVTAGWNTTFGASHYTARDDSGTSINTQLPRTTLKLFNSYTPQGAWSDLTVGGGVNWQNRSYYVDPVYGAFQQSAYALVSAFARYRLSPQFSVQLNVDNLLDKRYYAQFNGGYGAWGASRNGMLTFNYTF
ncbi:ferric-rhodotorulic acid/ferric-coprogen receptor FhuE [Xanthomonas campestris pv. raphani]|uniref:ferric-rhodotorulic acid/ferric-coprogen receptor FhuE n=1 Tax=Xanthomonas campestris TaxID=339 RepID=UPI002B23124E|nr:ferric-rhodotorulic acid/ferric-coprogen receptor FhuE [Xanthomonas campestris]MEA9770670.1 ferric-rhodotorulic acid/ferric-coprogen receptor FhuE [Xanthomonas campestris pv. raphani]MEA9798937.1 ferric-rhodotorulic acid/ferric-coprogen receptor FhuE [Xanthomonas campestris pv. raphani]MEA9832284.1 ferric-rhodotorulic acid/ferric-coprogen receptor FhuE [Xanthomonas campestris pv. raphani]MEA9948256.1 ferric-rhodotorulic acid/ferric-coprogen receptor FhuE [Xanthomonas campestris pv. raphani]